MHVNKGIFFRASVGECHLVVIFWTKRLIYLCVVVGELGKEAELPEKLSSNLDSDRQAEVIDLAEPELIDPVPEIK